jgi:hypothetical protein
MSTEPTAEDRRLDRPGPISEPWLAQIIRPFLRHQSEAWKDGAAAECAQTINFYLAEHQLDWADVREAARKAGLDIVLRFGRLKRGQIRHGMWTWRSHTPAGDIAATYRGRVLGTSIELIGVRGSMHLNDPTPAEVLSAARLVGLGGDSDA